MKIKKKNQRKSMKIKGKSKVFLLENPFSHIKHYSLLGKMISHAHCGEKNDPTREETKQKNEPTIGN